MRATPNYNATAEFFQKKAQKARDAKERDRFMKLAADYRRRAQAERLEGDGDDAGAMRTHQDRA
jgi:hypothetical protein